MHAAQNQKFYVVPEHSFPAAIVQIRQELSALRQEGDFTSEDGAKLYYEYFTAQKPVGSVVFVHGLSEFTKKYYEFAYYFVKQGYHVFLYDQRGHGRSHRQVSRPELIHINSFDQLVEDLDAFIEKVVRPASSGPLYLYAHSMGGAVGILYLAKYGSKLKKAVLTSPLFMPRMNDWPALPFLCGTAIGGLLRGEKAKFLLSGEYRPGKPYIPVVGDSPARMRYCLAHREQEPMYRSTPLTVGCARRLLQLRRCLLTDEITKQITVPTLMLCAETDTLVRTKYQKQFAQRCAACTYEMLEGANHALHTDSDGIIELTLKKVFRFYSE